MSSTTTKHISFFESVNRNFDMAAAHTDIPKGLLDQIKICNAVYEMAFPVKIGDEYQVIEAYRVQHSHHRSFQHIGILSLEFHVDKLSRPLL